MRVHDSQAYRKMDVTRKYISGILELREILLSFQCGFNLAIPQTLRKVSGAGFFLACEDFERMFDQSFARLRFFFLFFSKWRLARAY